MLPRPMDTDPPFGRERGSKLATYIVEKGKPLVEVVN